jgi:hypothetical protein
MCEASHGVGAGEKPLGGETLNYDRCEFARTWSTSTILSRGASRSNRGASQGSASGSLDRIQHLVTLDPDGARADDDSVDLSCARSRVAARRAARLKVVGQTRFGGLPNARIFRAPNPLLRPVISVH